MNTAIYDYCPDIPGRLRARGDEILGHGITNSEEQGHLDEAAEAELGPQQFEQRDDRAVTDAEVQHALLRTRAGRRVREEGARNPDPAPVFDEQVIERALGQ